MQQCNYRVVYLLMIWALMLLPMHTQGYMHENLQKFLCSDKILDRLLRNSLTGQATIDLETGKNSAVIIEQKWNTTVFAKYSSNKIKYDCMFRVSAHQNNGLYVLVTNLNFRRNETTGKCIDYIQFLDNKRIPSERYCHDLNTKLPVNKMISDIRNSEVIIRVFIDRNIMITVPLELRVVITAHSKCQHPDDLLCDPTDSTSCISRYFVHDNITNCLQPCRDEDSCFQESKNLNYDATKVTISAITSLIFSMFGAVFCVWGCWKYWDCISRQQQEYEASAEGRLSRQLPNELPVTSTYGSASPLQPQTPKDLPPSYESLFPER